MPIIIAILIVLAGGGVAAAAERSLPGSPLYPLKVAVNEQARVVFTFSERGRAEWDAERALRRLEEAERIAVEREFDMEARAEIERRFRQHADRVEVRIAALETVDEHAAADLSDTLQASLEAHERVLSMLAIRETELREKAELVALQEVVDAEGTEAAGIRARLEAAVAEREQPKVRAAAEGRRTAAENKIAEARKFIARLKARLGSEASEQAELRLVLAEGTLLDGRNKFEAGAYAAAFSVFSEAHRIAQEAKLLADLQASLKADVGLGGVASPKDLGRPDPREQGGGETEAEEDGARPDAEIKLPLGN